MLLFKVLQEFLLPSVFIFVLILVGVIFLLREKRKRVGKALIIIGIALYYLFSITPVADLILLPLESQYQPIQREQINRADAAVLLLGGKESDELRASELLRIYYSKFQILNQSTNFCARSSPQQVVGSDSKFQIVISGRYPLGRERSEAKKVKEYLIERGVPSDIIILEARSRTTLESARNVKEIVGAKPFFLVTSAYHMPRAMETFQKFGMNPIPAPADFKRVGNYDVSDFFPRAKNLRDCDLAFHEYFGILFYRMLGY